MNQTEQILDYLQSRMPAYPFNSALDAEFVDELVHDFQDIDVLEETKAFRWYYDNRPADRFKNVRLGLRRWIVNAWTRKTV
jgi:hypothetical protein